MVAVLQVPGTAKLSEPFNFGSTQQYPLGTQLVTQDGRAFRYAENGGTLAVAGEFYQSEVPNAADDDMAVAAAAAIGAVDISLTAGAAAIVADEWNGGYMVVADDAGEGYTYLVLDTPAASASTGFTLTLAHGIEVALTTSTTVILVKNPRKDVIIHPSPPTAPVVGMAAAAIAANQFGWLQTGGMAAARTEGTTVIGQQIRASETTDGTITPLDYDEAGRNEAILGVTAVVDVTTTEASAAILNIPY